jgi:hypothetical protein
MVQPRGLSNISFKGRLKQLIILIVAILLCVLLSQVAEAKEKSEKVKHHHGSRLKNRVGKSHRQCVLLSKKRNYVPKSTMFASNRKVKYKAMAEVDAPGKH